MNKTILGALSIGLLGGLLLSPPRALGSGREVGDSIASSLQSVASALKDISRNIERSSENRPVCECRCK